MQNISWPTVELALQLWQLESGEQSRVGVAVEPTLRLGPSDVGNALGAAGEVGRVSGMNLEGTAPVDVAGDPTREFTPKIHSCRMP